MKKTNLLATVALAAFMAFLAGCTTNSVKHESTGEYLDDSVLTTKVKAAIFNEPTLKSAEINVETYKGAVQLSGFVQSQADINKAIDLAKAVKGVSSVKNDMHLK